MQIVYFILDIR